MFFKPLKTKRESEHEDSWRHRFCEGFGIGSLFRSSENLIITAGGVFKAGAIKCKTQDSKWSASILDQEKFDMEKPHQTDIHKITSFVRPELDRDVRSRRTSSSSPRTTRRR